MFRLHDRVAVNALCFPGATLPEVADHWRALGARRVSFVSDLLIGDVAAARAVLDAGGHEAETVAHAFLAGEHLGRSRRSWAEPRGRLSRVVEAAAAVGARSVYLITGGHGDLTWEAAADRFGRAIAPCVEQARAAGVALMVENAPPLYADAHIAHTLRDAVTLAELAGIGVCIDVFACWTEAGLERSIERALPRCGLIQVSDYVYGDRSLPARAVPGDGAIPLARILGWALRGGYAGAFDLELIGPRIDREGRLEATRRAARHVGGIVTALAPAAAAGGDAQP